MVKEKRLLFSLTRNDFDWDYFRAGGKGGQNQNKVNSGVRCTHRPSGAVGEARDSRDQLHNRRNAFLRCVESPLFKAWHRKTVAVMLGQETRDLTQAVEAAVDRQMAPENLKIEEY